MFSDKKTAEDRYKICKSCDQLNKIKFCKQCGCFMPLKVKIAVVECPLNKWSNPWNNW